MAELSFNDGALEVYHFTVLEKYPMYNEQFIKLVQYYGDDISLSRLDFHLLQLMKLLRYALKISPYIVHYSCTLSKYLSIHYSCMLSKYLPILYTTHVCSQNISPYCTLLRYALKISLHIVHYSSMLSKYLSIFISPYCTLLVQ